MDVIKILNKSFINFSYVGNRLNTQLLSFVCIRMDSESNSSDSSFLDISSSASASPVPSAESSKASVTRTRHSIGARILAITLLDRNVPYYEITA